MSAAKNSIPENKKFKTKKKIQKYKILITVKYLNRKKEKKEKKRNKEKQKYFFELTTV